MVLPGVEDALKAGPRMALRGCGIIRPTELLGPRFPEFKTFLPRQQWEGLSFLALLSPREVTLLITTAHPSSTGIIY